MSDNDKRPTIEVVVDRDPDGDTWVGVYVDGVVAPAHTHVIDPGKPGASDAWMREQYAAAQEFSNAARDQIEEIADGYVASR